MSLVRSSISFNPHSALHEEIADAILFLMGNGFITGTTLLIDGKDALV